MATAVAVLAVALIGCTLPPGGPTDGTTQPISPSAETGSGAPETDQSRQPTPSGGGEVAVVVPGEFTICIPMNTPLRTGTDERVVIAHPEGDMTMERTRGYTWTGIHTATDPRFSGAHYYSWDGDTYTLGSGDDGPVAYAEGLRIENAEGAWQGQARGATLPDGASWTGPLVMTGEGAYEGLTAVLLWTDDACFLDLRGIIIEFPDPPVPPTSD
jgi:hypothetical protein